MNPAVAFIQIGELHVSGSEWRAKIGDAHRLLVAENMMATLNAQNQITSSTATAARGARVAV
jgi:hypothetical protein